MLLTKPGIACILAQEAGERWYREGGRQVTVDSTLQIVSRILRPELGAMTEMNLAAQPRCPNGRRQFGPARAEVPIRKKEFFFPTTEARMLLKTNRAEEIGSHQLGYSCQDEKARGSSHYVIDT